MTARVCGPQRRERRAELFRLVEASASRFVGARATSWRWPKTAGRALEICERWGSCPMSRASPKVVGASPMALSAWLKASPDPRLLEASPLALQAVERMAQAVRASASIRGRWQVEPWPRLSGATPRSSLSRASGPRSSAVGAQPAFASRRSSARPRLTGPRRRSLSARLFPRSYDPVSALEVDPAGDVSDTPPARVTARSLQFAAGVEPGPLKIAAEPS